MHGFPLLSSIDMVLRYHELRRNFEKENLQTCNVKTFFSKLPVVCPTKSPLIFFDISPVT